MRRGVFLFAAAVAMAQTPADVLEFFRTAAEALSENNASGFLDKFDRDMPGYGKLRDEIQGLLASAEVGSAIEILGDEGDDRKRSLELDWVLEIADQPIRRAVVKCQIGRRGKSWKITALEPIEFFKY